MGLIKEYSFKIKIFESREELGKAAAYDAGAYIGEQLKGKQELNCIFAAAPSQNEFLKHLILQDIDWSRINAFHMDEYIGLKEGDHRMFSSFLNLNIFSKVPFKNVYYIHKKDKSMDEQVSAYTELIKRHPVDITFMGIGENGHIAFNDPHVADFNDKHLVKVVELDERCRIQQVNDGCFKTLDEVPKSAITLTIPALMKAKKVLCMVPSHTKAEAVRNTVLGEISEKCPAAIMRRHTDAALYIDRESGEYLL